jgi:putative FmdB family regulatory protein
MPLYDYECEQCGPIREWGNIEDASKRIVCAACGSQASRVISAPNLALMAATIRTVHARNEHSSHEPRLVRREQLTGTPISHLRHR